MASTLTRWQTGSTVAIILLGAATSLAALLTPGIYNETPVYQQALYLQDLIILGIAVPVLALSLWLVHTESLRGEILWLGNLAFMVYIWASQALVLAYNDLIIAHVALLGLSTWTLVSGVRQLNPELVAETVRERLPTRLYIAYFGLASIGLTTIWLVELVEPLLAGGVPPGVEQFGPLSKNSNILDLAFVVPALAMTAIWLSRDRDWAFPFTGILVVFAALLAPAITSMTMTLALGGIEMTPVMFVGSIIPPVVGLAAAIGYLRSIPRRKQPELAEQTGIPG